MDPIIEHARQLAKMLAADPRFTKLRQLESDVISDPENRRLLEDYEKSRLSLELKQREFKPVTPEEKKAHAELTKRVHGVPVLLDLVRAQADYAHMMDQVNRTIHSLLRAGLEGGEESPDATDAPGS